METKIAHNPTAQMASADLKRKEKNEKENKKKEKERKEKKKQTKQREYLLVQSWNIQKASEGKRHYTHTILQARNSSHL